METNWQENRRIAWPVIVIVCFLLLVDLLPKRHKLHYDLWERLDYVYDATGLWQPSWLLFTPAFPNTRLYAVTIEYEDHSIAKWYSPDPSKLSLLDSWKQFRFIEYLENLKGEYWYNANLIRWLSSEYERPGIRITKITLKSYEHTLSEQGKPVFAIIKPAATVNELEVLVYDEENLYPPAEAPKEQEDNE